jgi:hypothetical protein
MNNDTLSLAIDSISKQVDKSVSHNFWMWIAIAEFMVIIILLIARTTKMNNMKRDVKRKVKNEEEIDFSNTLTSAFHAKELYDELKVKCHPDRYATDEEKRIIADSLILQIAENKHNYKRLVELRDEAKQKLNINV